jgi:hypothetical protein
MWTPDDVNHQHILTSNYKNVTRNRCGPEIANRIATKHFRYSHQPLHKNYVIRCYRRPKLLPFQLGNYIPPTFDAGQPMQIKTVVKFFKIFSSIVCSFLLLSVQNDILSEAVCVDRFTHPLYKTFSSFSITVKPQRSNFVNFQTV